MYMLGNERVKETSSYEHLGLISYNSPNHSERTIEKVSKGRRALSAASGIGIKHGGISMKACNIVFLVRGSSNYHVCIRVMDIR